MTFKVHLAADSSSIVDSERWLIIGLKQERWPRCLSVASGHAVIAGHKALSTSSELVVEARWIMATDGSLVSGKLDESLLWISTPVARLRMNVRTVREATGHFR